jgi:hypothetical protein
MHLAFLINFTHQKELFMENKQWLQQWLEKRSYTKEDILQIAGKRLPDTPDKPYTDQDLLNILGPTSCASTSRGFSGTQYR